MTTIVRNLFSPDDSADTRIRCACQTLNCVYRRERSASTRRNGSARVSGAQLDCNYRRCLQTRFDLTHRVDFAVSSPRRCVTSRRVSRPDKNNIHRAVKARALKRLARETSNSESSSRLRVIKSNYPSIDGITTGAEKIQSPSLDREEIPSRATSTPTTSRRRSCIVSIIVVRRFHRTVSILTERSPRELFTSAAII